MFIFCTAVFALFILIDIIPMIKNRQWKVLAIYSVLITTAYTFTALIELNVKIPSPSGPIKQIVTAIIGK